MTKKQEKVAPVVPVVPEPHLRELDKRCPRCPHVWGGHLVSKRKIVCPKCACSTYLPIQMRNPSAA